MACGVKQSRNLGAVIQTEGGFVNFLRIWVCVLTNFSSGGKYFLRISNFRSWVGLSPR
jgi:hypothetical protein